MLREVSGWRGVDTKASNRHTVIGRDQSDKPTKGSQNEKRVHPGGNRARENDAPCGNHARHSSASTSIPVSSDPFRFQLRPPVRKADGISFAAGS